MEQLRKQLRELLRARRRELSSEEQKKASGALLNIICREHIVSDCQHVALYLANDGEINPETLVHWLWKEGVQCYLPVLDSKKKGELLFLSYNSETPLFKNKYGIKEPLGANVKAISPKALDLVFMPLTGFTKDGQRMGMGGGFYDKTFAFTETESQPRLIGLAHECQKIDNTYASVWDIPMQGIVTDQQYYKCQ